MKSGDQTRAIRWCKEALKYLNKENATEYDFLFALDDLQHAIECADYAYFFSSGGRHWSDERKPDKEGKGA